MTDDVVWRVDILLSCGHIQIVELNSPFDTPQLGDTHSCTYCTHKRKKHYAVQNVGIPWHEKKEQVK